jgi:hypothetical protein
MSVLNNQTFRHPSDAFSNTNPKPLAPPAPHLILEPAIVHSPAQPNDQLRALKDLATNFVRKQRDEKRGCLN